jgi:hypothetical protein
MIVTLKRCMETTTTMGSLTKMPRMGTEPCFTIHTFTKPWLKITKSLLKIYAAGMQSITGIGRMTSGGMGTEQCITHTMDWMKTMAPLN